VLARIGVREGRNQNCPGVRRHVQALGDKRQRPEHLPPTISISIIALHRAITAHVLRSFLS